MRDSQSRRRRRPRQRQHSRAYPVRNLTRTTGRRPIHQTLYPVFFITLDPFIHRRPCCFQHRSNLALPAALAIPQRNLSLDDAEPSYASDLIAATSSTRSCSESSIDQIIPSIKVQCKDL